MYPTGYRAGPWLAKVLFQELGLNWYLIDLSLFPAQIRFRNRQVRNPSASRSEFCSNKALFLGGHLFLTSHCSHSAIHTRLTAIQLLQKQRESSSLATPAHV